MTYQQSILQHRQGVSFSCSAEQTAGCASFCDCGSANDLLNLAYQTPLLQKIMQFCSAT